MPLLIKVLYNINNQSFVYSTITSLHADMYEIIAKICSRLQCYQQCEFKYFFTECFTESREFLLYKMPNISFIELNLILINDNIVNIKSAKWGFNQSDMKMFTTLRGIDYEQIIICDGLHRIKSEYEYNANSFLTHENVCKHNEKF